MKGEKKKEKDFGSYAETYEYLNKRAVHTFKNGYYLESAIIIFQNLEIALRLIVILSAMGKGLSILTMKRILENDNRFVRLVDYFSLFRPEMPSDRFPEKLKKFNEKRNSVIHKLFFKKYDSLNKELKDICEEGFRINSRLNEIMKEIVKNPLIFSKNYFGIKGEAWEELFFKRSKVK